MHWHAFSYTGSQYPPDAEAKDVQAAVRPLVLSHWFRKPRQMHHGAFADAESGFHWLRSQLRDVCPRPELLADVLAFQRACLERGQDAYAAGYSRDRAGMYVRCLLTCPRTGADRVEVVCPGPPREAGADHGGRERRDRGALRE